MIFLLLLVIISLSAFCAEELDSIRKLENSLPKTQTSFEIDKGFNKQKRHSKFSNFHREIKFEKIISSGTQFGIIPKGSFIQNVQTFESVKIQKPKYVEYFNLEDEFGYKYLKSKDGSVSWRISTQFVEPIKQDLEMYVPPLKYTPAPQNLVKTVYDRELSLPLEFGIYAGLVQSNFMADLMNDTKAGQGTSNQYGVQIFTKWRLPFKIGLALHYEKASFNLSQGGNLNYSSLSFGPQLKSREFDIFENPIRFQTQFRYGPFAQSTSQTYFTIETYKFNSTDILTSLERPIKNQLGEFVFGLYFQVQWLNLKDQKSTVSLNATTETNRSIGLNLSQVFE